MLKRKSFLIVYAITVALLSCGNKHNDTASPKLSQLSWLEGTWEMKAPNGTIIEHWDKVNDTLMQGSSYFITLANDTPEHETVKLILQDTTLSYTATVVNPNESHTTAFKETQYATTDVHFENPEHDFPKLIVYKKLSADAIYAMVSAGDKKLEFNYTRKK